MAVEQLHILVLVAFLLVLHRCYAHVTPLLTIASPSTSKGCGVDGTKCQFSSCGAGKKLVQCSFGFAGGVTGGAAGPTITVSYPSDDPRNPQVGTLRHAVNIASSNQNGGWIVFDRDMEIGLSDYLRVGNNTTIDGRGVKVKIINSAILLSRAHNVILENFEVSEVPNFDTVHIYYGSRLIWVDHLSSSDSKLGLVSVVSGATDVTISNCHLTNHVYNMLLGANDRDEVDRGMRVTIYRNFFEQSMQRMPHCRHASFLLFSHDYRVLHPTIYNLDYTLYLDIFALLDRWGYCHVVNNYYRDWTFYCIGGRVYAKIYSEGNVFDPGSKLEVTPWYKEFHDDMTPTIESHGDLLLRRTTFTWFKHPPISKPGYAKPEYYPPIHPTATLQLLVERCAGALAGHQVVACMRSL
ncbi:putative pectate lyase 21 [Nymphaea thermarum]|nr:putative pectate lyase 21 [Nymphaea thermarum]